MVALPNFEYFKSKFNMGYFLRITVHLSAARAISTIEGLRALLAMLNQQNAFHSPQGSSHSSAQEEERLKDGVKTAHTCT